MEIGPRLEFAKALAARRKTVWSRHVLIPALTDNSDAIATLAGFAVRLRKVRRLDVLPVHQVESMKNLKKLVVPAKASMKNKEYMNELRKLQVQPRKPPRNG